MLWPVLRDAVFTALIVGPILVMINYGDVIVARQNVPLSKVMLTMTVPFLVAFFSGARAALRQGRDQTIGTQEK